MTNMNPVKHNDNPLKQGDGRKSETEEHGGIATGLAEKASDTAARVGERAEDMASSATQKAKDLAGKAEERADKALGSVGGGMHSLGWHNP